MRRGFTLMEVLISVLIFSIISLAMIGVLTGSVKIFRAGETARAAHDDAVAVLAQLDDDLALMVPPSDGGFLYARVLDTDPDTAGFQPDPWKNMLLSFKMRNPDARAATKDATTGTNDTDTYSTRLIVCWYVDSQGWLNRTTKPAAEWDGDPAHTKEIQQVAAALALPGRISKKCLYFGVDLSLDQPISVGSTGTRPDLTWANSLPNGTDKYCTEANTSGFFQPFPRALRVSVTLTGGSRNLISGTVVRDDASGIRITGVGQVPTGPGALARIGDPTISGSQVEWVHYDMAAQGILKLAGARPTSVRRTGLDANNTPVVISHLRGEPVVFGTTYSLVRTLPR